MRNNVEKYSSLTLRDKETLKYIIKGCTNKKISNKMHISHHIIRSNRMGIWQKLEIKHFRDCFKYEYFFN